VALKAKRQFVLCLANRKKLALSEFEKMSAVYDELWQKADEILKKFNPCNIKKGQCLAGYPCCGGCEFLSKKGCTEKSLACKLWLCDKAREEFPECAALLDELEEAARRHPHIPLGEQTIKEDIISFYKIVG
jgi:hypothetical protein